MKRGMDVIGSLILTVVFSPVLLLVTLAVKLTSRGPVIFKQRRIGLDCREFMIFKFRTMYADAPGNTATHLLENPEKFITPVGNFLRKTSLDELPQLFNVLKGDMSFVGPRPALYNQYDLIELREKGGVHRMRPGVTGWAQVNGRDELSIPVKVEYDKYYVENYSLWLDIKILFLTGIKVFLRKGVVEGKQQAKGSNVRV